MFYFQQLLEAGLNGIDRTSMIPAVVGIAYAILLIGFLIGLYHAAMRGGDVQSLAATGIKYLVIAIVLANWSSVFRQVNGSFNQVAQFIDSSSGAGDMFLSWMDQLKQQVGADGLSSILPSISGTMAAITTALMVLAAYLIYAIMVVVFAFFYVLYGCVLYVLGPLVLALLPMPGVGQLAKSYATNLMIWNAWGILYATFGSLITAIQFNRVDTVINQGFLKGFFRGSSDSTILGLVSVFYALALGLIPLIAKRVISGDVGSAVSSMVRAGAVAAGTLMSGVAGFGAGSGASSGSGTGLSAGAGTASSGAASTSTTASVSSSTAPPQPSMAQTIRAGVMSAVNGAAPPAPSSAAGGSGRAAAGGEAGSGTAGRTAAGSAGSTGGFRPVGVVQTAAFHAGKFAGSIASGGGKGSSSDKQNG
jgi:hypothetical protein